MRYTSAMKLVVGVSGGPDSMALLDQLVQSKQHELVVAHVNYHHRPTANRDQAIVASYCAKHGLGLEVYDAPEPERGNFQAWARKLRYDFFVRLVNQYQFEAIAVAHQRDDSLETYWFQKQRGGLYTTYGLAEWSEYDQIPVWRPLLTWTKADCQAYCDRHRLSYGMDESNEQDEYMRNRIRHHILPKLDQDELLADMKNDNLALEQMRQQAKACLSLPVSKWTLAPEKVLGTALADQGIMVGEKALHDFVGKWHRPVQIRDVHFVCWRDCFYLEKRWQRKPAFVAKTGLSWVSGVLVYVDQLGYQIRSIQADDQLTMVDKKRFLGAKNPLHRHNWPVLVDQSNQIVGIAGHPCVKRGLFMIEWIL